MREKLRTPEARRPTMGVLAMAALLLLVPAPGPAQANAPGDHGQSAGSSWQGHSPPGWSAGAVARGTGFSRLGGSTRVREVQRKLNRLGYASGEVDGLFGPITDGAVRRFQRSSRLSADGIVGQHTLGKLRSRSRRLERLLARGVGFSKPGGSSRVRALQRKLNRLSYSTGVVDGLFGPLTDGAVRRFQSRHGLRVDGIVGLETMARLQLKTQPDREIESPAPIPREVPDRAPSGQRGIESPAPTPPRGPARAPSGHRAPGESSRGTPWAPWQGQPLLAQWATILLWTVNALLLVTALALVIWRISSGPRRVGHPAARLREAPEGAGLDRPVPVAQDAYRLSVSKVPSPPPIERLGARLSLSRQRTAESTDTVDVELRLFAESAERHWEAEVPGPRLTAVAVAAEDMHERVRSLVVPDRLPTVAAALNEHGVDVQSHYLEEVSFVVELTREVERELLKRGWA
jgi:peptidoglycan hydrolase-like protein with peptidoglycan-binding domain